MWWTLKVAVDDLNAKNLISGVHFNLLTKPNEGKINVAVQNVVETMTQKSLADSPVVGFVGDSTSAFSIAMSLTSNAFKVLQCSGTATSPELSVKSTHPTFFRTVSPDTYQAPAIAHYIKSVGWKKVAVFASNNAYGLYLGQEFQSVSSTLGIKIKLFYSYDPTNANFTDAAQKIYESGSRIIVIFLRETAKLGMVSSSYVYIGSDGLYTDPPKNTVTNTTDLLNLERIILISPLGISASTVFYSLQEKFLKQFPLSGVTTISSTLSLFYDCVLSIGEAVKDYSNTNSIEDFSSVNMTSPKISLANVKKVNFLGATGNVSFDKNGDPTAALYKIAQFTSRQSTSLHVICIIDGKTGARMENVSQPNFFEDSTKIPSDSPDIFEINLSSTGNLIIFIYFCLSLAINLVSIIYLIIKKNAKAVKATSLFFLFWISIGLTMIWISIVFFINTYTDISCLLQQWVFWIAFGVVFSSLLVKVFRVYKIFSSLRVLTLQTKQLFGFSSLIVLGEIIILATFTILDPPRAVFVELPNMTYYTCYSHNQVHFTTVMIVYNGLLLLLVTLFAYKTRNVYENVRETFWIFQLSSNITLCCSITTLLLFLLNNNNPALIFYIRMTSMAFLATITYGRIVYSVLYIPDKVNEENLTGSALMEILDIDSSHRSDYGSLTQGAKMPSTASLLISLKDSKSLFGKWEKCYLTIYSKHLVIGKFHSNHLVNTGISILCTKDMKIKDIEKITFQIIISDRVFTIECEENAKDKIIGIIGEMISNQKKSGNVLESKELNSNYSV
ncbi:Metabotropic GABA-B receptor subtype 3A [Clydaea vesicula]|uniref:Metabotropic GABA-B receptor subtype 3A n=1 Tax=Clydaea vesicula TaxID=447962 RepID=A0AAD5XVN7_9FUNG|nr:Metabotropic GABA-B receptor subtype 3A [Clydaea vesicula]